jgi:hypothetical protein
MNLATLVVAAALTTAAAAITSTLAHAQTGDGLNPRVLVLPVDGTAPSGLGALGQDVGDAMARGAARTTPDVARATASLAETAVIVGCEADEADCLDSVAAALNVDQLLVATISVDGDDATIEVIAVTREAEPVRKTFKIRLASRAGDLQALEDQVPVMLEAGEARKGDRRRDRAVEPPGGGVVTPPPVTPAPEGKRSWSPLVVAGGGVAVGAAGAVFWTMAKSKQDEIDRAPVVTPGDLERLRELESDAKLRALVGNVLVAAGAVAVVGGVVWYLVQPRKRGRVEVGPVIVPGGGGVALGGAW